ncbi:MAG: ThuA domain-containing protein [Bryobacteraceae bacterium]
MKNRRLQMLALGALLCAPLAAQQSPLRIFIRASVKTHGPGQHDYPRFLADWKKLLADRGAVVNGSERFPTAGELSKTDVLIDYAADGGTVKPEERAILDSYLKRGGGVVVMHDGMCSNDASWFAGIIGGAKQHGERNWRAGALKIHFEDRSHPIVNGAEDFEVQDEMFFRLRTAPEMHVLATSPDPEGAAVPQLWTYEKTIPGGQPYRAFVSLQGHLYAIFELPVYRTLLLRGIAWAGKRPANLLVDTKVSQSR